MKYITLDEQRLGTRAEAHAYFRETVNTPSYYGNNLDALNDWLSETDQDIRFILTGDCVRFMCTNDYAYRILMVLGRAADTNPHIHISFRK